MIVKDEARCLARCLDSVMALAPEIIVAATGSSDSTLEIARQYGATVSRFDFRYIDLLPLVTTPWRRRTGNGFLFSTLMKIAAVEHCHCR